MPTGSCLCGSVQYSFTSEPAAKCICHCIDCRKISGSTFSTNLIVPDATFSLGPSASLTSFVKRGTELGRRVELWFCGDCGSTLYTLCEAMPGVHVIKAGTLGDIRGLEEATPQAELFVTRRVGWVARSKARSRWMGWS